MHPINAAVASKIVEVWKEYEARSTKEAQFVYDMDKFECMLQGFEYEKSENMNLEGFQQQGRKLTGPEGMALRDALWRKRNKYAARAEESIWVAFIIGGFYAFS